MPRGKGSKITPKQVANATELTKNFLTKYGPLLLTAGAAAVKHYLDDQDERRERHDSEDQSRGGHDQEDDGDESDKNPALGELRREARHLKRSLKRKEKKVENEFLGNDDASSIPEILVTPPSPPDEDSRSLKGERLRGRERIERRKEEIIEEMRSKSPHSQHSQHLTVSRQTSELQDTDTMIPGFHTRDEYSRPTRDRRLSMTHRRRTRRHSSPPDQHEKNEALRRKILVAGRVAAISGTLEALHVSDYDGKWAGPKGKRVATAAVASFRASASREKDPDMSGALEDLANVARGLVVTRIIHGSSRRLGEDWDEVRKERRYSIF